MQEGTQPNWGDISHLSEACTFYWVRFEYLEYRDNILYYVYDDWEKKYCTVIPRVLVGKVLTLLHNNVTVAHLGIKTLSKGRERYFWYKMSADTRHWCVTWIFANLENPLIEEYEPHYKNMWLALP